MTSSIAHLLSAREGVDIEFKKAAGKDGTGTIPLSVWETVGAMANTSGGIIVLGAEELADGTYSVVPGLDVERMRTEFWTAATTPDKITPNVIDNKDVRIESLDGGDVLVIEVPRAERKRRPVYLDGNPMTGTYRRYHDGDHRATQAEVQRLFVEASQDTRDAVIVAGITLADLEAETIDSYRREMRLNDSKHPFLDDDDATFLRNIGGLATNEETGALEATRAGVLMFGNWHSLRRAFYTYDVDYRLEVSDDPDVRWTQRITTDGKWSGNLYDFSRRVMNAITKELPVPFKLNEQQIRVAEGPEHAALREAVVNALIHADYDSHTHIVIRQTSRDIMLRNGGTLRVSVEEALEGGHSDCRNLTLQKMFQLVGLGEKVGSGLPKIRQAWREKGWADPQLIENFERDCVELRLRFEPENADESSLSTMSSGHVGGHGEQADDATPLTDTQLAVLRACLDTFVLRPQLQERTGINSRTYFTTNVLRPLVTSGLLELQYPSVPRHRNQAYQTTEAGRTALTTRGTT